MNYFEEIDPIGMSKEEPVDVLKKSKFEMSSLEHDLICGIDTDIRSMHNDLNELNDLIEGYETYTPNRLMLNQLKTLHLKLVNGINAVESGFNEYKNLHE